MSSSEVPEPTLASEPAVIEKAADGSADIPPVAAPTELAKKDAPTATSQPAKVTSTPAVAVKQEPTDAAPKKSIVAVDGSAPAVSELPVTTPSVPTPATGSQSTTAATPAKPGKALAVKEETSEGSTSAAPQQPTAAAPPRPPATKGKAPIVKKEIIESATPAASQPPAAAAPPQPTVTKGKAPIVKKEIIEGEAAAAPQPTPAAVPPQPTATKGKKPVVKKEIIENEATAAPQQPTTAVPPQQTATKAKTPMVKVKQEIIEGATAAVPQPPTAAAPSQPKATKSKAPVVKQEIIEGATPAAPQQPTAAAPRPPTAKKAKAPIVKQEIVESSTAAEAKPPTADVPSRPTNIKDKTLSAKEEPTESATGAAPQPPTAVLPAQPTKTKGKSPLIVKQTASDTSTQATTTEKAASSGPAPQSSAGVVTDGKSSQSEAGSAPKAGSTSEEPMAGPVDASSTAQTGDKTPGGKKAASKKLSKKAASSTDGAADQSSNTPGADAEETTEAAGDSVAKQNSGNKADKELKKMLVNHPKKPKNAYMLFSESKRAEVEASNPEAKMGQKMKILGEMWAAASDDVKEPFQKQFEQDKVEYEQKMAVYTQSDEYKAYLEAKQAEAKQGKTAKRGKNAGKEKGRGTESAAATTEVNEGPPEGQAATPKATTNSAPPAVTPQAEEKQDAPDAALPAEAAPEDSTVHPVGKPAAPRDVQVDTAPSAEKPTAVPPAEGCEGGPKARTDAVPPTGSPAAVSAPQSSAVPDAEAKQDTSDEVIVTPEGEQKSNNVPAAGKRGAPDAAEIKTAPPAKKPAKKSASSTDAETHAAARTEELGRGRGKGKGRGRGRNQSVQQTGEKDGAIVAQSQTASQAETGNPGQLVATPDVAAAGTKRTASMTSCMDCGRSMSPLKEFGEDEELVAATIDNAFCGCCTEMLRRQRKLKLNVGDFVWCGTNPANGRHFRTPVPAAIMRIVMGSTEDSRPYLVRFFHASSYSRIAEQDATSWTEDVKPVRGGTKLAQAVSLAVASGAPPVPGLEGTLASQRATEVGRSALKRAAETDETDSRAAKRKRQFISELLEMQQVLAELNKENEKLEGKMLELRTAGESQLSQAEAIPTGI